jgi:hypothetical protein
MGDELKLDESADFVGALPYLDCARAWVRQRTDKP